MENPFEELSIRALAMIIYNPDQAKAFAEEALRRKVMEAEAPDMPTPNPPSGETNDPADPPNKKRTMSVAGRKAISIAQKRRWANTKRKKSGR